MIKIKPSADQFAMTTTHDKNEGRHVYIQPMGHVFGMSVSAGPIMSVNFELVSDLHYLGCQAEKYWNNGNHIEALALTTLGITRGTDPRYIYPEKDKNHIENVLKPAQQEYVETMNQTLRKNLVHDLVAGLEDLYKDTRNKLRRNPDSATARTKQSKLAQ